MMGRMWDCMCIKWHRSFGWRRIARARISALLEIIISVASFYIWIPMLLEACEFPGEKWNMDRENKDIVASVQNGCGPNFYSKYGPMKVGNGLGAPIVLLAFGALGNIVNAMFLVYASMSPEESAKMLLGVYLFLQIPLLGMCLTGLVWLQDDVLCYFEYNLNDNDAGRQFFVSMLVLAFLFFYKPLEVLSVLLHWRYLNNKEYPEVHWAGEVQQYEDEDDDEDTESDDAIPPEATPSMNSLAELEAQLPPPPPPPQDINNNDENDTPRPPPIFQKNRHIQIGPRGTYRLVMQRGPFTQCNPTDARTIIDIHTHFPPTDLHSDFPPGDHLAHFPPTDLHSDFPPGDHLANFPPV